MTKRNKIPLAAAALMLSSMAAMPAFAMKPDGELKFKGTITDVTCTVDGGGAEVTLNGVPVSKLGAAGAHEGFEPFSIKITGGATCADGTKTIVKLDTLSANVDPVTGTLNNIAATDPAKNVQVQLTHGNGDAIHIVDDELPQATLTGGSAEVSLGARYYATGVAEKGKVESALAFTLEYAL